MSRQPLVLVLAGDVLTRRVTDNCLQMYGYDVLTAESGEEALAQLEENPRRIGVLVTDADIGGVPDGLTLAKTARSLNDKIIVIYTARLPHLIPARQMVANAPIVRTPYFPQQIVGVISQLRYRPAPGQDSVAA
jgi:CheY-like chemotaxis protein